MNKHLIFIAILIISGHFLYGQRSVTGIIKDTETNAPLSGAMIRIKGTQAGTVSATDGRFTLTAEQTDNIVLQISFLGYQTVDVTVSVADENIEVLLDPDVRMLGTAIVTATRSRREIFDVPVRVDVVSRQQTEAIGALSADDYLLTIPGISVSRGASFLGRSTVSLRGMGSEAGRTLVLIDGIPVNKTDGGTVNWNAINAEDIEQVEVMKGPGSSIHGGNAMGGVINLISPVPSRNVQGFVSQSYGTFETTNTQAGVMGRNNNFFWGINGRYRMSDGYITTPADEIDEFSVESFLDEYQVGARAGYFIRPDQLLETSFSYYLGQRGTGSKFTGFGFENENFAAPEGAYNEYTSMNGRIVYRATFENNSQLNITLFGQRENYQNIRESVRNERISRYDVESVRDDLGFLSSFTFSPLNTHTVTTGIDLRHGAVDGADIYLTSTDQVLNLGKMNQLGIFFRMKSVFWKHPGAFLPESDLIMPVFMPVLFW